MDENFNQNLEYLEKEKQNILGDKLFFED